MNLFLEYQEKIFKSLKALEKKELLVIPSGIKNITVELPPKDKKADLSCNAAMVLSKSNNTGPLILAELIKKHLISNFKEFKSIEIAGPGFLNIYFNVSFWEKYLSEIIKFKNKFGSNRNKKKKYNIEFVSANPTGPLHVGHCRGAILGDVLANILIFNGSKVVKEYYVNDHGGQINNFLKSVYYRILEIKENKSFPEKDNLYPGEYIKDIANDIIKKKSIKNFSNFKLIEKKLFKETIKCSMDIISKNLDLLGVKHDNFVYESNLVNKKVVLKVINKLQNIVI